MRIKSPVLRRFFSETEGAVAIIVALTLVVLMGFVALGIDTASLFRERHKLQSITDLAALSAVPNPAQASARISTAKSANGIPEATTETVVTGRYLRNPTIPPDERFTPLPDGSPGINAVSVRLRDNAPLTFGQFLTEDDHVTLRSTALAARTGAVSFSLDSALAQLDGTALGAILSQSFGTSVALSAGDVSVLADSSFNAGDLVQALSSATGFSGSNPADILNEPVTPAQVVSALQGMASGSLQNVLAQLDGAADTSLIVADIIGGIDPELGLTVVEFLDNTRVSAQDVLLAVVAANHAGQPVSIDTVIDVPGVLSTSTTLVAAEPPASSGWVALGEEGVTLHRAAMRLALDTEIAPSLLGPITPGVVATQVNLPLYLEIAGATATLESMSCNEDPSTIAAAFRTAATPLDPANGTSVAALYLGDLPGSEMTGNAAIDPSNLGFADVLDLTVTLPVPLLPDITVGPITLQMRSTATIGQSNADRLLFTRDDLMHSNENRRTQSFGSEALLSSSVTSLLSPDHTEIRIKPGQDGVVSGLVAEVLNTVMSILPAQLAAILTGQIDTVLDETLASLGVELGAGQLKVHALHCERARLVR